MSQLRLKLRRATVLSLTLTEKASNEAMRDSCSQSIVTGTEKLVRKTSEKRFEFLRTSVCDSPNFCARFYSELTLPRSKNDLLRAIALSHYGANEEIRVLLRLSLEQRFENYDEMSWMKILLDRSIFEIWLKENAKYTSRSWFGSILEEKLLVRVLKSLRFVARPTKVRKPQRKRGYTDKGSLKPSNSLPGELSPDYLEPVQLEETRALIDSTTAFLQGMLW